MWPEEKSKWHALGSLSIAICGWWCKHVMEWIYVPFTHYTICCLKASMLKQWKWMEPRSLLGTWVDAALLWEWILIVGVLHVPYTLDRWHACVSFIYRWQMVSEVWTTYVYLIYNSWVSHESLVKSKFCAFIVKCLRTQALHNFNITNLFLKLSWNCLGFFMWVYTLKGYWGQWCC